MSRTIKVRPLSGTPDPTPRAYEAPHAALARHAAAEGIVLLKNEGGILPLARGSKLALFGAGASHTIKGGTGSGDVNERGSISIYQGLKEAGFQVTSEAWIARYQEIYDQARITWRDTILGIIHKNRENGNPLGFFAAYASNPWMSPAGDPVYATDADTAVYVLSRIAGEGADRDASAGDYFLSDAEHQMLVDLGQLYSSVIVIVNAGGVVDLSFMDEVPAIKALLVVSQPGMEGGRAVADVLLGDVVPSGKLTDTWAINYQDYPSSATFSHNNGDVEEERYVEGIYVGYRFFDTFGVPARYGFGFGLSYTTFAIQPERVTAAADGTVNVTVQVTNIGDRAGKEVVQVYAALPDGRLEKEARRLVAFAKTGLIAPGECQVVTLSFGPAQLESYDEEAAAWVLEQGVYGVYVGASLGQSKLTAALTLDAEKVLTKVDNICPLKKELDVLHEPAEARAARYAALKAAAAAVPAIAYDLTAVETRVVSYDLDEPQDEAAEIAEKLTVDQLVSLATGDPRKGQGSQLGNAGASVPGSAAQTSDCAAEYGVPSLVLADGPAGLRLTQTYYVQDGAPVRVPIEMNMEHGLFYEGEMPTGEKYYQFCTAVPVGTLLAQSWDMALLEEVGAMVGEEMEEFGVQLWLAPGMNIHRNPLCGRNFEYFAEDPLLSGKCAAAITRGVQSHPGIGTTIKHYACNNQEDNRMGSDSILTERTLREIYLKGFEIAIGESKPMSLMTSYNLINGVHGANCYDTCTKAARCEFGFDGAIMTDWTTTNKDEKCTAAGCMRAGNDMVMPGLPMDHENLRKELETGELPMEDLRRCISRTVRVALRSNCFE